jgi:glycosyltransferase involved in cell wall biosynthesis
MEAHCRECASQINAGNFDLLFANACIFFRVAPIAKHVQLPSVIFLGEPNRWLYEALPHLPWAALPKSTKSFSLEHSGRVISDFMRVAALRVQVREEVANAAAFDLILVNSLYSRESVLRAYGLESKVCLLGIDHERFKPTGESVESFALGLGALDYTKGPDRAIRALGCVDPAKRPELIWIANVGKSEYQRELESLAVKCGVRLTVKVGVSDAELVSLLSRAAMLLYTSRLEPFGLAPLEANACGAPVVGIAEGGIRETVQNEQNGLLVDGDDPQTLGRAIERLIDEKDFAKELRKRSVYWVRSKWQLTSAIDRLEQALVEVKQGHHRDMRSLSPIA